MSSEEQPAASAKRPRDDAATPAPGGQAVPAADASDEAAAKRPKTTATEAPATEAVATYPIQIKDGAVWVAVPN